MGTTEPATKWVLPSVMSEKASSLMTSHHFCLKGSFSATAVSCLSCARRREVACQSDCRLHRIMMGQKRPPDVSGY